MRKGITLAALCMLGALVFSTTAMAYDDLITDDTAAVKAVGGLCGSVGFVYSTASKGWDADGNSGDLADNATGMRLPIRVNYGVMDKLTVFGILPVYTSVDPGTGSESGLGDIWLGAKYSVMPALTLRGALDIPSGDYKKGLGNAGGFGVDVAAMSAYKMDKIDLNGQVGLRYNVEDGAKMAPGLGIYVDVEGLYAFTEAINGKVGIEFMTVGDGKIDGNDSPFAKGSTYTDLKVGGAYKVNEKCGIGADLFYTLAGKNLNQNMTILVKVGYSVK